VAVCVELPGAPEGVKLIEVSNTLCKLTWNGAQYDVIGYYIHRYNGSSWDTVNSTPIPTCSVSLELSAINSENEFRVCAENSVGVGPPSEIVRASFRAPPPYKPPDRGSSVRLSVCLNNSL